MSGALPKCGESVEGITVPLGNPDALNAAGKQLMGVAAQIRSSSSQVAGMPSLMSSWAGPGSSNFAELTGHQATSRASTSLQVMMAAGGIWRVRPVGERVELAPTTCTAVVRELLALLHEARREDRPAAP